MKNLRENGYIDVDPDGFLILLDAGRRIAEKMYERHTLLSDWLITLGVDPDVYKRQVNRLPDGAPYIPISQRTTKTDFFRPLFFAAFLVFAFA